jgi:hypothetical protein
MGSDADKTLSPGEILDLQRIAGIMVPASDEFDVPGADDPLIVADITRSLGRDADDVRDALAELSMLAGGAFAELDPARAETVAEIFLARTDRAIAAFGRVILQSYYRDDRVLRALQLEPRAPFPLGHTLEQGDWSLLDVVRDRPQLWRDDRGA